jgi:tellurite resistance protein TerC
VFGLFEKSDKELKKAVLWSCFWVCLALVFNVFIYFYAGKQKGLEFLAGYLIEKSLSIDNVFVFYIVFSFFKIPNEYQKRVLFHGVLAALIFRFLLIFAGSAALQNFFWMIYILGAFLLLTGLYVVFKQEMTIDPGKNFLVRWIYRKFNVTKTCEGKSFFVQKAGTLFVTPLFLALLAIEGMDILFALDSIPAIFGITTDTMIIYTSNAFAILGLRSLYVVFVGHAQTFQNFKRAAGLILSFVGLKIVISPMYSLSVGVSLVVILTILLVAFIRSLHRH